MPDIHQVAIHFAPELLLVCGVVVVLCYDLAVHGRRQAQAWLAGVAMLLAVLATLYLFTQPAQGIFESHGPSGELARSGTFLSDGFTHFFRLVSLLAGLLVLVAGERFMNDRTSYGGEFFALLLCAVLAMDLMAGANDLVAIFLSVELLSIASYVMTGYVTSDALSVEGALKYFLYGSITASVMIYGFVLLYGAFGSTSLPIVASGLASVVERNLTGVALPALLLVIAGMGFKLALVPFHQWSPDAYHGAASPVTAFLSVGPKAAGFAVLTRFFLGALPEPTLANGWLSALAAMAVASMILGNIAALTQRNIKRMMAYSSIAQAGYMLVGVVSLAGRGTIAGITPIGAVLVFVFAYVFANLGAFAVIIAMDEASGGSEIDTYAGLMQRSPLLAIALFVFFLSLIGIPPLAGFLAKFAVFAAAIADGRAFLAVIGVVTGVISVGYYLRVGREMLFVAAPPGAAPVRIAPGPLFVIVVALVMVLAIGLLPGQFLELANSAGEALKPMVASAPGPG